MGTGSAGEPRDRLGAYLRRQYRREHMIKRLASDIDCTPRTASNILDGHWPTSRHWAAIVRRFGRDVIEAVFGPEIDETVSRLQMEVAELEDQLEQKRARVRKAQGGGAGDQALVASDVDGAAEVLTAERRPFAAAATHPPPP